MEEFKRIYGEIIDGKIRLDVGSKNSEVFEFPIYDPTFPFDKRKTKAFSARASPFFTARRHIPSPLYADAIRILDIFCPICYNSSNINKREVAYHEPGTL